MNGNTLTIAHIGKEKKSDKGYNLLRRYILETDAPEIFRHSTLRGVIFPSIHTNTYMNSDNTQRNIQ